MHSISISSSFVAFSLHLILIPSPSVVFSYYFIYFSFYAKLYNSLLLLKKKKQFSQTDSDWDFSLVLVTQCLLLQPKLLGSLGKTEPCLKSLRLSLSLNVSFSVSPSVSFFLSLINFLRVLKDVKPNQLSLKGKAFWYKHIT